MSVHSEIIQEFIDHIPERIERTPAFCSNGVTRNEREWKFMAVAMAKEIVRLRELEKLLNKPELHDFTAAVVREAAHQNHKWGPYHDAGKDANDWFAVISYLHGKQVRNYWDKNYDKYVHHIITMAAVCCNWHSHAVKLLPAPPEAPNENE